MKSNTAAQSIEHVLSTSSRLPERIEMLGLSAEELTPAVQFAISALFERLDDMGRELSLTRETLSEIERLVDVDCLAPVPNRRAFMRRLSWAISMLERYDHPSAILYFDLNDFKQINDTHGHAAGDLAIRHVCDLLSSTLRESDLIARIGGDEFAILMYYANEEAARKRGKKIAESLRATPFVYKGTAIPMSAAYGYHALKKGDDAESALSSAVMSMYVEKRRLKSQLSEVKA